MAEYKDYGPGWNASGRAIGNVTTVMDKKQYEPYSMLTKVFQYPFDGRFGNTGWIDQHPESTRKVRSVISSRNVHGS
jgi:hypothetical protein